MAVSRNAVKNLQHNPYLMAEPPKLPRPAGNRVWGTRRWCQI